jgi:hypothetical protein
MAGKPGEADLATQRCKPPVSTAVPALRLTEEPPRPEEGDLWGSGTAIRGTPAGGLGPAGPALIFGVNREKLKRTKCPEARLAMLKRGIILVASYMAICTGSALADCEHTCCATNDSGKTCFCDQGNCPNKAQCSCANAKSPDLPACFCAISNARLYTPIRVPNTQVLHQWRATEDQR